VKKSSIYIVSELKRPLLELPELVTDLHQRKFSSIDQLFTWLVEIEKKLKQLNFAECAEVAGWRAQLSQLKFDTSGKPNERKKRQFKKALEIIQPTQACISRIIAPLEEKIDQARDLIKQILNVAASLHLLPKSTPQNFNSYIHHVWNILSAHEQIKNGMNNIKSLVGMTDGLQILAEEIDL